MGARILIVDDDADLLELLSMNLSREGYAVDTAASASDAMEKLMAGRPDLILLDVMLGDMSGIKLTKKWKTDRQTAGIPIILLTAKDSETDVVVGLSVGADDYVTKPFSTPVLAARIDAVLRRVGPEDRPEGQELSAGAVRIVPVSRQVFVDGRTVDLTDGQYNILLGLVSSAGKVLSRRELKERLGADAQGESERIVDVHIASLRKKLGAHRKVIRTVHNHGYRIDV